MSLECYQKLQNGENLEQFRNKATWQKYPDCQTPEDKCIEEVGDFCFLGAVVMMHLDNIIEKKKKEKSYVFK